MFKSKRPDVEPLPAPVDLRGLEFSVSVRDRADGIVRLKLAAEVNDVDPVVGREITFRIAAVVREDVES